MSILFHFAPSFAPGPSYKTEIYICRELFCILQYSPFAGWLETSLAKTDLRLKGNENGIRLEMKTDFAKFLPFLSHFIPSQDFSTQGRISGTSEASKLYVGLYLFSE
ncbi:hypothetical protein NPIL_268141 [Nephila pilipes]|uniref:Uncharacterized protein n=1 Tax=Nephila pilipes TaxID=299642 RepID=A0A8X6UPN0_NEPPI|nr:hypothetical protein NPIL_268141 [Nephila pilipes]